MLLAKGCVCVYRERNWCNMVHISWPVILIFSIETEVFKRIWKSVSQFNILLSVRPNLAEPYLVDPHLVAIVS